MRLYRIPFSCRHLFPFVLLAVAVLIPYLELPAVFFFLEEVSYPLSEKQTCGLGLSLLLRNKGTHVTVAPPLLKTASYLSRIRRDSATISSTLSPFRVPFRMALMVERSVTIPLLANILISQVEVRLFTRRRKRMFSRSFKISPLSV